MPIPEKVALPFADEQIKPGPNELKVALDCATHQTCGGRLAGPVFLTVHEPKRPPYLGRGANARHADLVEWQPGR